jgi:hypothetical protein
MASMYIARTEALSTQAKVQFDNHPHQAQSSSERSVFRATLIAGDVVNHVGELWNEIGS